MKSTNQQAMSPNPAEAPAPAEAPSKTPPSTDKGDGMTSYLLGEMLRREEADELDERKQEELERRGRLAKFD